ncbi:MAG: undecaprenyl-diphosphatase [Saprospiraceae bacterium]|jgi:undecaprenyl-diphosphatase
MGYYDAFIYGILQGLTEFLPVSSSGHLAILPKFLSIDDPGVFFDLAMHLGTALAILVYFKQDIIKLFIGLINWIKQNKNMESDQAVNMVISTFVTLITILLIKDFALAYGRTTQLIGINLIFFGIIMLLVDQYALKSKVLIMDKLNIRNAILIGFFQALAIFPGVSRSGITLTIARGLKMDRVESTRYSFLLALPIVLGGFVKGIFSKDMLQQNFEWGSCIFGIAISFVIGIITIHFFLQFIKKVGLIPFSIYRVLLGTYLLFI